MANSNAQDERERGGAAGTEKFRTPNNIRQMGEPKGSVRIYIEDYVYTFLKKLEKNGRKSGEAAVLCGRRETRADGIYLFIRSALHVRDMEIGEGRLAFAQKDWSGIYEKREEYFDGQDLVGWFLSLPSFQEQKDGMVLHAHRENFAGNDRVLFVMDPAEGEEAFYLCENAELKRQPGFYIYYEKNEEMQSYMIAYNENRSIEETEQTPGRVIPLFSRTKERENRVGEAENKRTARSRAERKRARAAAGEREPNRAKRRPAGEKPERGKSGVGETEKKKSVQPAARQEETVRADGTKMLRQRTLRACAAFAVVACGAAAWNHYRTLQQIDGARTAAEETGAETVQDVEEWLTVDDVWEAGTAADAAAEGTGATDGTDTAGNTETAEETGTADGTDIAANAAAEETNAADGTDTAGNTETAEETGTADGTDIAANAAAEETNAADGTDTAGNTETAEETGTADGTDIAANAAAEETNAADGTDTAGNTEAAEETGTTDETAANAEGIDADAAETTADGLTEYTIRRGDTLSGICLAHYGTVDRIDEICEINNILPEDVIYAGQTLMLPQ